MDRPAGPADPRALSRGDVGAAGKAAGLLLAAALLVSAAPRVPDDKREAPYGEAQDALPAIPEDLLNSAAVLCIRISDGGDVDGAFIFSSTGDEGKDGELLDWARSLKWPPGGKREERNIWFPMPVAIGEVPVPKMPKACAPRDMI